MPDIARQDAAHDPPEPKGVLIPCLLCGEMVRYTFVRGDPRMRYAAHWTGDVRCDNSGEPVNAEGKR